MPSLAAMPLPLRPPPKPFNHLSAIFVREPTARTPSAPLAFFRRAAYSHARSGRRCWMQKDVGAKRISRDLQLVMQRDMQGRILQRQMLRASWAWYFLPSVLPAARLG